MGKAASAIPAISIPDIISVHRLRREEIRVEDVLTHEAEDLHQKSLGGGSCMSHNACACIAIYLLAVSYAPLKSFQPRFIPSLSPTSILSLSNYSKELY